MWRCGLIAVLVACGSKDGGGGGAVGNMPAELGDWTPKGAVDVWQGAWTTQMNLSETLATDAVVALDIKGEGAKAFDGKTEYPLGFEIDSPCTARFSQAITEGSLKGGTSWHTKQFVIKDGKLLAGEGAAGMRKGKAAVACTMGPDKLHTLDDKGVCKKWERPFDRWKSKDQKCAWSTEDGKDVLTVGDGNWTSKLVADGDLLMDDQFARHVKDGAHARAASYDAAKQAATAQMKVK